MIGWLFKRIAQRKRRRRTIAIAEEIVLSLSGGGIIVMSEDQFFDINQVKEVIDALAKVEGVSIRANVFQSQVIFHAEDTWNRY